MNSSTELSDLGAKSSANENVQEAAEEGALPQASETRENHGGLDFGNFQSCLLDGLLFLQTE